MISVRTKAIKLFPVPLTAATEYVPVMDSVSETAKFVLDWAATADEVELRYRVSAGVADLPPLTVDSLLQSLSFAVK